MGTMMQVLAQVADKICFAEQKVERCERYARGCSELDLEDEAWREVDCAEAYVRGLREAERLLQFKINELLGVDVYRVDE